MSKTCSSEHEDNSIQRQQQQSNFQTSKLPNFQTMCRVNEKDARENKLKEKKECDIPFCENFVSNYYAFDTKSIKCITCEKSMCEECCDKIWKGEWNGEQFYKPKYVLPGLKHEVFMCPFCRSAFDRMIPCEEEGEVDETDSESDEE